MSTPAESVRRILPAGLVLLFSLLAAQVPAFDITGQSREPVKVQADWAELDERTGESLYRGNVVVEQSRSRIEADEIRIQTGDTGIEYFKAVGVPAYLLVWDNERQQETRAWANTMEYLKKDNAVILEQQARVQQSDSSFRGDRIIFNTLTQVVNAESVPGESSSGRVEIIYRPPPAEGAQ